jgi:predicted PurR-regulated permease PerM
MIPPFLLGLAESGWATAIIIVVAIIGLNVLVENVLEPSFTGKKLKLSPTIVFASFFFWAWLLGPIGALLSMPITVLIVTVMNQDAKTRWIAQLMSSDSGD